MPNRPELAPAILTAILLLFAAPACEGGLVELSDSNESKAGTDGGVAFFDAAVVPFVDSGSTNDSVCSFADETADGTVEVSCDGEGACTCFLNGLQFRTIATASGCSNVQGTWTQCLDDAGTAEDAGTAAHDAAVLEDAPDAAPDASSKDASADVETMPPTCSLDQSLAGGAMRSLTCTAEGECVCDDQGHVTASFMLDQPCAGGATKLDTAWISVCHF
jgi:hypothetical protein